MFYVIRAVIFPILNHLGLHTAAGPTSAPYDVGLLLNAAPAVILGRGNTAVISVRRPLSPVHCLYVPLHGTLGRRRE